jgi:hypothetical protein
MPLLLLLGPQVLARFGGICSARKIGFSRGASASVSDSFDTLAL